MTTPPSRRDHGLPSLARRLAPLVVFAIVLAMAIAGVFGRSTSQLALRSGHAGPAGAGNSAGSYGGVGRPDVTGAAAGISPVVGAIPGAARGHTRQWRYATGQVGPTGRTGQTGRVRAIVAVTAKPIRPRSGSVLASRLSKLHQADVLVVGPASLPVGLVARLGRLRGVQAALPVEAGRIKVNGVFVNVLGVNPSAFRPFAAAPTARSTLLWRNIAAGGMAISYTMASQARLSLAKPVLVTGTQTVRLPVAGFGTVGIGDVDAVVSDAVAKTLGMPAANAILISAPTVRLDKLMAKVKEVAPAGAAVAALVTQVIAGGRALAIGAAGAINVTATNGAGLTARQLLRFLVAAESRIGMPYVWGAAGPAAFDCSGLVQWSMAQAGVAMPRVAADQARTGPLVPLADLQPGDLLFYHTDPTAPVYISHVAIYIGNGQMLQAPEPGMTVEIVAADFGAGFAGAIRVYPTVASAAAGSPAG